LLTKVVLKKEKYIFHFANIFKSNKKYNFYNIPLLIPLVTNNERITMINDIIIKENNNKHSWTVSKDENSKALRDYFNIIVEI